MAKFCGNCGARWEDDVRVCGKCGTPFGDVKGPSPVKVNQAKKIVKTAIILVLVAAILLAAWSVGSSFIGKKGLIRQVMNAYKADSVYDLVDLSSDVYYYSYYSDDAEDYFEDRLDNIVEYFDSTVGYDYKLSYKINGIRTLSDRQLNNELDDIADDYDGFNVGSIEKMAIAEVTLTAKQGSRHVDRVMEITMTKEDDGWRLLYIN